MKNFKINKNQQPLSQADIAGGKDFGKLLKAYKAAKVPFYKSAKLWVGASSVLVASVLALIAFNTLNKPVNICSPFIAPPFASADIQRTVYILNAQSDSTITYTSGSKIHVPANAFLDKNGKVANGKVELHYREFKKVSEILLAGIPMSYDSAGEQFYFETAGMMEISASQNGEALKTNPAALLEVDVVSAKKDDRFNTYYLDTVSRQWKYIAQPNYNAPVASDSTVTPSSEQPMAQKPDKNIQKLKIEIAGLEKQKPQQPKKQDKSKPRFSIKADPKEFPELAVYKGVKFQVEDDSYKSEKADISWADIELKKLPENNKYQITFINPNEKYSVEAVPVFGDKDYDNATTVYNQKFANYEAALTKKKADEAALEALAKARIDEIEKTQKTMHDTWAQSDLIYRSFQVSDFGYWNSDHPCRLPAGNTLVKLMLIDAISKKPLDAQVCYLVEKERDVLFPYSADRLTKFQFDPSKQNGIWVITADNKIAVAKYADFKSAQTINGQMRVEVSVMDKALATTEEIKHYLEL